mmetsp:Transcript_5933/g.11892  ORF Transcript_5933/g.11892 Transcript_5933/m.11892 type:complete len:1682 (-) Transcript_5933:15-5060(-)
MMSAPAPTASSRASTPTNATAQQPPSLAAAIDQAPSSSIVAATMMRLPADQLAKLRDDFVSRPGGLTMNQFVSVMLKYSEKQATLAREATERLGRLGTPSPKSKRGKPSSLVVGTSSSPASPSPAPPPPHLISTVADLVELFHQIDVNGDDSMEWDEFTGFIINMAMASTADFHFHDHWKVRPVVEVNEKTASADRCRVPCVRWIPEIQRILVAAGPMVQVFDPYNRGVGDKLAGALGGMQLCGKIFPHDCEEDFAYKRRMMRGEDKVSCIQAIFLPSLDLVCILSSDLRINFHKAINRNGVMSESVKPAGRVPTDSQQYVMAWDDVRQQLFTAGCENEILVWKVFEVKQKVSDNNVSKYKYVATQVHLLDHHNDTIKDMITVQDPDNELDVLITASLDKSIKVFDLETLRPVRTLVGHTSGVRCLTYDFHGNLYSAGFEHDIYVWDLEAGLSYPLKKLVKGHVNPIIKIVSPYSSGRLCSLDVSGRFSWWDIRRNVALENHERCIQSFDCPPHLCQTFDLAHSVENALEFSTNGMTLVAGSKKIHAFDSVDVRPPEAPPTACVFNSVGYNFVSVHEKDLKVWDPDSGRLLQEVPNLSATEITNITFDSKGRKAIISNQGGEILIFNNSNWSKIASLPTHSSEISCLMYAKEDKCIITGSWDRSLRVYDDYHNNPSSSLLRCITNAHDSDITSIAHDFSLGLIATSSVDGNVKIWDFQFLTLDCDVTENLETESEVTVLKFVQPYPLLLSADSEGGISMIPVRPYLGTSRYKTMLRFENAGSNNYSAKVGEDGFIDPVEDANCQAIAAVAEESCAASAMEILYDPHSGPVIPPTNIPKGRHLVVTGDEHGWVRIFDISTAITKCQLQVPKDSEMPKCQNSYNPYRRCERDGNMYKAKEEKEVEEPSGDTNDAAVKNRKRRRLKRRQTTPKFASETITEDDVTLICAFPAHKEAINTLEIIQDPPSILTSSVDCSVMLWDMNGNAMGTLTRGREADSMWKRTWSFPIDKAGRRKAQLDEALSLYHSVREMEANERVQSDKHAEMVKEMAAIRARTPNSRNASPTHRRSSSKSFSSSSPKSHFPSPPKSQLDPSSPSHREEEKKEEGKGDLTPVLNGGDSMTSSGFNYSAFNEEEEDEMSEGSYFDEEEEIGHGPNALTGAQWEEEKLRLFGQLKGETTWTKTPKEVMREQVMEKRINNTKAIFKKLQAESKKDKEEDPYKFKKKKRKKKKKKKKRRKNPNPAPGSTSFSSTAPNLPQHPEVDEEYLMQQYKPAFSSSVKVEGSHNVKYKNKKKKSAGPKAQQQQTQNPYTLNARPSQYTKPSFLAPSSTNAMKLQAMRERQVQERELKRKQEDMKLIEEQARKRGVKLQSVDHLLENFNNEDDDSLERSTDSDYVPPAFSTLEEAKIHYERKQLERQSEQLLSPLKSAKNPGKKKKGGKAKSRPLQPSPEKQRETNDLLDAMDDLSYQITVLQEKLNTLSSAPNVSAEEKEENGDLLSCLLVVATHINKHKEILESGSLNMGSRPSHVSILESAQTWRLTLLSVIDTLANRPQAADPDLQNLQLDLALSTGKKGDEAIEAMSPGKGRKKKDEARAFASPIDDIRDESARQRILIQIGNGISPSSSPSRRLNTTERNEVVGNIKSLYNSKSSPPSHLGGLVVTGQASSPLPGLSSLGIAGLSR